MEPEERCPCGTGATYGACCGPAHDGRLPAPTAEALMRSRYTAYVLGLGAYLVATCSRPPRPGEAEELAELGRETAWVGLSVHSASGGPGDAEGRVAFTARSIDGGGLVALSETSRFIRGADGRWMYVEGAPTVKRERVLPNQPCPCGSGNKFKHCHG